MSHLIPLIILFFSVFIISVACGPKQDMVEKIMEDGVEAVINHLEPYRLKGEPSSLILMKELSIDAENASIAELGLVDIWAINVDASGNI